MISDRQRCLYLPSPVGGSVVSPLTSGCFHYNKDWINEKYLKNNCFTVLADTAKMLMFSTAVYY